MLQYLRYENDDFIVCGDSGGWAGGTANALPEPQERSFLNVYKKSRFLDERGATFGDGRKTRSTFLSDRAKALSDFNV